MTIIPNTQDVAGQPDSPCGPDCIYIDGACRCYASALASVEPDWMAVIKLPF